MKKINRIILTGVLVIEIITCLASLADGALFFVFFAIPSALLLEGLYRPVKVSEKLVIFGTAFPAAFLLIIPGTLIEAIFSAITNKHIVNTGTFFDNIIILIGLCLWFMSWVYLQAVANEWIEEKWTGNGE